jgi:iron(III) transport system permease protein
LLRLSTLPVLLIAALIALPVLAVVGSVLQWDAMSSQMLSEMARTVLPSYAGSTLLLCLLVALGTAVLGMVTACAVTLFEFRGRRLFEWALLLPLAMPTYVTAYAYTDFLQFSGPAQTWLRASFGLEGRVLPEIRNLWGAAFLFVVTLYPYVYLLARAALSERAAHLMEAARMLGAPFKRRIRSVAMPLARPAIAAGVALALMETLADFGVSSYFGIQTFTAGIYKAWLAMDNRTVAAQLAVTLLIVVAVVLKIERRAQSKMRFTASKGQRAGSREARPMVLRGAREYKAILACALPVLLGFVLPLAMMVRPLWSGLGEDSIVSSAKFLQWSWNSLSLAGLAAVLASLLALSLAYLSRQAQRSTAKGRHLVLGVTQLAAMGYAVPGAVIVVGLLIPAGWLQAHKPEWLPAWINGALITTTLLGVIWAYLVRFSSVALQSVQSGYARIPTSMDDSARTLGVGYWALLARVHAPLLRRSVVVAALLVFVDVMKELPATLVLRPFNHDTLAVIAYQLARDERLAEAALPSLALVLVGLIPVIVLSRSLKSN